MADLCTLAQVKARIDDTDAIDDAVISELITNVSDWIEDFTKRRLTPDDAANYVMDSSAGSVIEIPRGFRSITSVGYALTDQPQAGGTYTTIPPASLVFRPDASLTGRSPSAR